MSELCIALADKYEFTPRQISQLTMEQICLLLDLDNPVDGMSETGPMRRPAKNLSRSIQRRRQRTTGKYSVCFLADVPGYAYHLRANALAKHAPDDFDATVLYWSNAPTDRLIQRYDVRDFDLIVNFDYQSCGMDRRILEAGGKTKLVISHNRDSRSMLERWPNSYTPVTKVDGFVICNNKEVWEYHGRLPRTCNISNGIDGDLWGCDVPIEERPKRVLWCGGSNPKKGKGWQEVIEPLRSILAEKGFETDFRPFSAGMTFKEWLKPQPEQRAWYNSGFCVLCASNSEGTPNTTLEGGFCGCVPVTTPVGNVLEFGKHLDNCVLCDREVSSFVRAIEFAWNSRVALSASIRETMQRWTYGESGNRAKWYYALFRRLIRDGADSITPFSYKEKNWDEV